MRDVRVAERYSQSIFELAESNKQGEALVGELKTLQAAMVKEPRFLELLKNPLVNRNEKRVLLNKVLGKKTNPLVEQFVALLIKKGRVDLFDVMCKHLQKILNQKKGVEEATIVSARALDSKSRGSLQSALEKSTKKKMVLEFLTNPKLLGGVQVRIGNQLIDGSLRSKLDVLEGRLRNAKI